MQVQLKPNDMFTQEIFSTTQLRIFTLNNKETKFSIVKNNFIFRKSNKIFRIQLQQNKQKGKDNILDFFQKFTVKNLIIDCDYNYEEISFDMLEGMQFQLIKILIKQNQNSLNYQSKRLLQSDNQNQDKFMMKQISMSTEKFINNLLNSKTKFNTLQFQEITSLNQLKRTLEIIKNHEQKFINLFQSELNKKLEKSIQNNNTNSNTTQQSLESTSSQESIKSTKNECKTNKKYRHTVKITEYTEQTLFLMVKNWLQNLCMTRTEGKYKSFQLLNETIFIHSIDNQHLLTLIANPEFGVDVRFRQEVFLLESFCRMLEILFQCPFFLSFEMQYFPQNFQQVAQSVFKMFSHRKKYLIKIKNHIEITHTRVTINSHNLPQDLVTILFKFIEQSNAYYEFVFYGTEKYLSQAYNLFRARPFTKFNFFMPINQLTNENGKIISQMESNSQDLKYKILQFHSMLKNYTTKEINLIKDVFMILHWRDFN